MATETVNINTTLADDSVTNAKLANVATNTLKGRVAAGTGDPQDLTADQASTVLDTATDPFVRTSNLPAGGGDVVGPASSTNNNVPQWDGTTGELLKDGLGVSTGGNDAADSTKLAQYNLEGQLRGSVENSSTPAIWGQSSGNGYAGLFRSNNGSQAVEANNAGSGAGLLAQSQTGYGLDAISAEGVALHAHAQNFDGVGTPNIAEFFSGTPDTVKMTVGYDGGLTWTGTGAASTRTGLGLGTLATQSGTFSGTSSGTNTGDQDLSPYQTIAALAADVRAVVLTGLSLASSAAVAATDSILAAFGKLQAFNDLFSTVGLAIGRLTNPSAVTWVRMNADNTATARTASETRTDLGLGTAAVVNTGTGASDVPTITDADARYLLASNEIIGVLGSTQTTSSTSLTDCTGLSVAVAANSTYQIEGFILFQSNNVNNGIGMSLTGPASPTHIAFNTTIARNLTTNGVSNAKAYDEGNTTVDVGAANTTFFAVMNGTLVNGANAGTLQFRFASENGGNSVSIIVGSSIRLRKIA